MGLPIDFYFDFSCPYAYLASTQRRWLARESGSDVHLRPFLLGGVFAAIGQAQNLAATLSPAKARHNRLDVIRWATWFGVPLAPPHHHPMRTVEALRCLLAAPAEAREALTDACFAAYWVQGRDLSDAKVLTDLLLGAGLDAPAILTAAQSDAIKAELRERTEQALQVGVFGAPAFVVGDQLFWGQDRLPMVVRAAQGWRPDPALADFHFVAEPKEPL
ncbi:MAG: 2-hydroxychromene-2-carboxylate isomerase [Deltaproteobacteria bacterium]|nr:2-hydroxychromene-2-carboxylate isomerase [Deltaproteobacteria bacterium]